PGTELVEPLVTHPLVQKVTFTGSPVVGWKIDEMAKRKRVTLELGSNAANIIFEDCEVKQAAEAMISGGFTFAVQACIAAQRIYVHEQVVDEFLDRFVTGLQKFKIGDPREETTTLGPKIHRQLVHVRKFVAQQYMLERRT